MADFQELDPFFLVIEEGLSELVDGGRFLDRCFDLRDHPGHDPAVTLQYASAGRVTATGRPSGNHHISVVTIADRKIVRWRDSLAGCE